MIFEILMLCCFGVAWPLNIINSLRSHSTRGKDLVFLLSIFSAYVFGIIYKVFFVYSITLIFYCINLLMVTFDLALYLTNRTREIRSGEVHGYFGLYC